jgi:hypothetical protein
MRLSASHRLSVTLYLSTLLRCGSIGLWLTCSLANAAERIDAASDTTKPGQVCRRVWDDSVVEAIGCGNPYPTGYSCPLDGSPCSAEYAPADPNCGRVTKLVCAPQEMFHAASPTATSH